LTYHRLILTTCALLLCWSSSAWAQEDDGSARGRELAREGLAAYQAGHHEKSEALFRAARDLYPTGQVLRMWGYSLVALNRWLEAEAALEQALTAELKPLAPRDYEDCEDNLTTARDRIGKLSVSANVSGAMISVDGGTPEALPIEGRRIDEGTHRLVLTADGFANLTRDVEVRGRAHEKLNFALSEPLAPTPSAPIGSGFPYQRTVAVGGAALGTLGASIGITTLVSASSLRASVIDDINVHNARFGAVCSGSNFAACSVDAQAINNAGERADTMYRVGLGLTIAGGVVLTGSIALFALSAMNGGDDRASRAVTCGMWSPAGVGAACLGRF